MFKRKVKIVLRKEEEYVFDRDNRFVPPHPLKFQASSQGRRFFRPNLIAQFQLRTRRSVRSNWPVAKERS